MCKINSNSWKLHYGGGICSHPWCWESDLDLLTWHHRDKQKKHFNPSKKTGKVHAVKDPVNDVWRRARKEIAKCDLLCRFCHEYIHKIEDREKEDRKRYRRIRGTFRTVLHNLGNVKMTRARKQELNTLFWEIIDEKTRGTLCLC